MSIAKATLTSQITRKATDNIITRNKQLKIEDIQSLQLPLVIKDNQIIIEKSTIGYKLKQPVIIELDKVLDAKEIGIVNYVITSLLNDRPQLIPYVFNNQSLLKMARRFLRHFSGSLRTCMTYTVNVHKYTNWLGHSPDQIIADLKPVGAIPDPIIVQNHCGFLNDYLGELQDDGLAPGAVNNCIKAVKTFYRANGVKIELNEPLNHKVTYKDRAPTPEELAKVLELGDVREKFMVTAFALGGFRIECFTKLQYRHVKHDLENNIIPLHIKVEKEITKGKYHDYDTFLGPEAVMYLQLYFDQRKKGNCNIPPEIITDTSPLIRDSTKARPKGVTPKTVRKAINKLYKAANILRKHNGCNMYDLRVHSLRKYFKTQLTALSVPHDYVEYMMGHTISTYDDVQSLGIDKLRNIYHSAGLAIRPKTRISKIDTLKEIIRAYGMNPDETLTKHALLQGAVTCKSFEDHENFQLKALADQLKVLFREEINRK
ncbi:MAG: tyrosine-type recombinase/integrase [Nitrososphaerota archaeon]|jgi:site-specific recombinase XerD|nr:tyrosine-type recombinase/integrase [Nitrososphaerota archaeon]